MPGRLRKILAEIAGKRTRFPPATVEESEKAERIRAGLERMLDEEEARFFDLFVRQYPLRIRRRERGWFRELESVGLVTRSASMAVPCVRLFPFFGRFVAADLLTHGDPDQVFSLMFEQVYFVRHMEVRPDDCVLEVGLGSGAVSLFAADLAHRVTAIDINERALAFARFNEALCPGAEPIEMHHGSLFEPLDPKRRFDLVLCNPPFELVPEGESWFLHSHGG